MIHAAPPAAVILKLVPQKSVFQKGEPVVFEIVLKNGTHNKVIVDRRFLPGADETFGQELTLLMTGPGEKPIPNLALFQPSPLTKKDLQFLLPGRSIAQRLPLSNVFILSNPGEYQLQAIYDTRNLSSTLPFWRGRIVSSPVVFSITDK